MKFLKNWFGGKVEPSTTKTVVESVPEAWHLYPLGTKYISKEVIDFYNQFNNSGDFNTFEQSLLESSVAYSHYVFNEPSPLSPERHGRIMMVCSNGASLDECATQYKSEFPKYTKRKQRQEILDSGKEDFITHLKLLKENDPELARQKVLEILQEVV